MNNHIVVEINNIQKSNWTPFPVVIFYFRRGCPLDDTDLIEHDSALHLATRTGNNEMVAILLRKGANTDLVNKVRFSMQLEYSPFRNNTREDFVIHLTT